MLVREAIPSDVPSVAKIHIDVWKDTYEGIIPSEVLEHRTYDELEDTWLDRLFEDPETKEYMYVAENEDGELVGFIVFSTEGLDNYQGVIKSIYVYSDYQRQGIGKMLFNAAVEKLLEENVKNLIVWTYKDNKNRRFYEKMGGKIYREVVVDIEGRKVAKIAYVWDNIEH
ncbi:GNAT family N-acetyltransferase [Caloramator sp. mosi_1]|uniref:GNAT family N-acetyltransferase n=1 Tax=Caloramator sp. mosi_1 TaxID=3023090 RepID=UPI00235FBDE6|nr:GNAT family N-acetyltransferase [Caloramator sp. mosi_1]WDC84319.1 GNAT family N-acetyltransferase [Caloramator sp. mosi_1]